MSVLRRLTSACHRSSELYYGRNNVVESPRSLQTGDTQSYATAASLDQLLIRPKTGESVSTVDTARTTDSDQIKHFVIETLQGRNALAAINVAAAKFAASGRTPTEMKEFQISMLDEARSAITVRGMARMHELCRRSLCLVFAAPREPRFTGSDPAPVDSYAPPGYACWHGTTEFSGLALFTFCVLTVLCALGLVTRSCVLSTALRRPLGTPHAGCCPAPISWMRPWTCTRPTFLYAGRGACSMPLLCLTSKCPRSDVHEGDCAGAVPAHPHRKRVSQAAKGDRSVNLVVRCCCPGPGAGPRRATRVGALLDSTCACTHCS